MTLPQKMTRLSQTWKMTSASQMGLKSPSPGNFTASRPLRHHTSPTTRLPCPQVALTHLNLLGTIRSDQENWGGMNLVDLDW